MHTYVPSMLKLEPRAVWSA